MPQNSERNCGSSVRGDCFHRADPGHTVAAAAAETHDSHSVLNPENPEPQNSERNKTKTIDFIQQKYKLIKLLQTKIHMKVYLELRILENSFITVF